MADDYFIGVHARELERLRDQHAAWRPETEALWKAAGFRAGQHLADLGCGPGYSALDLARSYCDRLIGMASGRIVFDGAPAALTDSIARELYDLEANEVMGTAPEQLPAAAQVPALGAVAAA